MTGAIEVFVRELARASRRAMSYLYRRGISSADRNDIVAGALAWCWENRESYSLTIAIEAWFGNAVKDSYKTWRRGELKNKSESLADIPTGDDTQGRAEALEAAQKLLTALPEAYRMVATLQMQGVTKSEMTERGISKRIIDAARARIKQLRRLMPDDHEYRRVLRSAPLSGEHTAQYGQTAIDQEIEQLEFPPPQGADCPPCWRCCWFYGFLPAGHLSVRMKIVEPEVRDAVANTEAEKVRIATGVRDGSL